MAPADPRVAIVALTDSQVMDGVAATSPDAVETLYDRHGRLSFSLAVRILGDAQAAAEVVHEAFLAIWRRSATYHQERGSVQTWICSIVRDRAVDRLRDREGRAGATPPLDASPEDRSRSVPSDAVVEPMTADAIREALGALPSEQRDILERAYFAGCSQIEIGDSLGVPLERVRSQTRSALRSLRHDNAGRWSPAS